MVLMFLLICGNGLGINMKNFVCYTALVFILLFLAGGYNISKNKGLENKRPMNMKSFKEPAKNVEFYIKKAKEDLKQASLWIIEEGVSVFSRKGKKGLHRKLVDEWGVIIRLQPLVERERYLALFYLMASGIDHTIHNLYREKVGGNYYEFWLIKVTGTSWSGAEERSIFFITKTKDIYGKRKVLKQSDQFIPTYQVSDGEEIMFPVHNLKLLYDMEAWLYPQNYKNSDLKNKRVKRDDNGGFYLEK